MSFEATEGSLSREASCARCPLCGGILKSRDAGHPFPSESVTSFAMRTSNTSGVISVDINRVLLLEARLSCDVHLKFVESTLRCRRCADAIEYLIFQKGKATAWLL